MNARKLLLNDQVEVRQFEKGLQGSWYSAVVIGVSDMSREVEYDELLCETEDSKLVESVPVTGEIEGVYKRPSIKTNYRGRIRPLPSNCKVLSAKARLSFGFCVDVLFNDAWWEGVIFDSNDRSDERSIFFPDEGDERRFKMSNVRVTHEWDEFSGTWRERGVWTLVKLIEELLIKECKSSVPLAKFTKPAWSCLRVNYGFEKMISDWTCGAHSVWKKYFMEVISVMETKSIWRDFGYPITCGAAAVKQKGNTYKKHELSNDVGIVSSKTGGNTKSIKLLKSKHYHPGELKNPDSQGQGNAYNEASIDCSQNEASSKTSYQTDLRSASPPSSNQFGETSNVCSILISDTVDDGEVSSGHLDQVKKKPSQIGLTRRNRRNVENNLALQKKKPFLAHRQQLINFQSNSPKKQNIVAAGLHSQSQVNKKQRFIQRQMERNLVTKVPKCNLRMLSFTLRKKRSCLKVKKRFPKKIQRSNAKNKFQCTKEGSVSELSRKDDNVLVTKETSQQEFQCNEAMPGEKQKSKKSRRNDSVCFVCQYGDDLLPCDNCTSSYHKDCIGLKEVPDANWFCPSCRCGICGLRSSNEDGLFTEVCYQCSRQYHRKCLNSTDIYVREDSTPNKFCSKRCFQICVRLHEHLQTLHPIPMEGLSWTITRSRRNDYNIHDERIHPHVQLSQVMNVLHECFEPTIEPCTKKDLVAEVVYNSSSKFKRLDFHGFYVMALQNGDELACVATLRVHGHKVAEMPLVATPFKYRRKGMCRLLMREMEKMLMELGVEKLVLPAISQLRETWVNVFGFEEMPTFTRQEFSGYPFLVFSGTSMFHKELSESTLTKYPSLVQQPKTTSAGAVSQGCKDDSDSRFGSYYMRNRRPEIITRDQRAIQGCLYFSRRRKRGEASNKDKTTKQSLHYAGRRRAETPGNEHVAKQGCYRHTSPIKYVYKRRRILANREGVH